MPISLRITLSLRVECVVENHCISLKTQADNIAETEVKTKSETKTECMMELPLEIQCGCRRNKFAEV